MFCLIFRKYRLRLIEDWRYAWSYISVNCMAIVVALQLTWAEIPLELRSELPHGILKTVTIALLGFGIVGRFVRKEPSDVAVVPKKLAVDSSEPASSKSKPKRPIGKTPVKRVGKVKRRPF